MPPNEQTRSELSTALFSPARSSLTSRDPTCNTPLVKPIHGLIMAFFPRGEAIRDQYISKGAQVLLLLFFFLIIFFIGISLDRS